MTRDPRQPRVAPVAIVTGAGSGIGRAIALGLARLGWRLVVVGRDEAKLDATMALAAKVAPSNVDFVVVPADLADVGAAESIVEVARGALKRIDALVNNAGIGLRQSIDSTTPMLLDSTFAVNTYAPAMLIAAAWRGWAKQRPLRGVASPCVVNISSMAAIDPFPGFFMYGASKCALDSLTRSIVNESKGRVRGFSIAPGAVETPLLRAVFTERELPRRTTMDPSAVASVALDCILGRRDQDNGRVLPLVR